MLLAVKNMGGETSEAWRTVLDDLVKRRLRKPEFLIVDGGTGLEQAGCAVGRCPHQRRTVHKHRNLLAHAPQRLHDEISADYNDMIYAASAAEVEQRRRVFIRKWRLKCKAVADSLEEVGDRLFTPAFARAGSLPGCRSANGRARAPLMQSNASMRSSSAAPKLKQCCLPPRPPRCCSGHCSPQVRSPCAKSTDGRR